VSKEFVVELDWGRTFLSFFVVCYFLGSLISTLLGAFETSNEDRHNTTQAKVEVVGLGIFILLGRLIFNWW
jgi:membrane-anchored glycerophosphoryl diester phosphodiesterase (GDPDase)